MGNFRKLLVWQKAKELAVKIYKLVRTQPISKDFGFRDQIQRAAVSIPANIAEGDELDTDKQSIRHFYIEKFILAYTAVFKYQKLRPVPFINRILRNAIRWQLIIVIIYIYASHKLMVVLMAKRHNGVTAQRRNGSRALPWPLRLYAFMPLRLYKNSQYYFAAKSRVFITFAGQQAVPSCLPSTSLRLTFRLSFRFLRRVRKVRAT
jgi:hypothetical protein